MRYANSFANGFTGCHPIGIGSVTSTAVITSTIAASATSKQAERQRSASVTLVTLPSLIPTSTTGSRDGRTRCQLKKPTATTAMKPSSLASKTRPYVVPIIAPGLPRYMNDVAVPAMNNAVAAVNATGENALTTTATTLTRFLGSRHATCLKPTKTTVPRVPIQVAAPITCTA